MPNLDKFIGEKEKEYIKDNGIEMRLFVDLMIANQGDRKVVNKKLDELKSFLLLSIKQAYQLGLKGGKPSSLT